MKRIFFASLLLLSLAGCGSASSGRKVMARPVPERADDFVFENNLICGRIYGKGLEGETISPGIDIWVKLPGKLVADEWYSHISETGSEDYYHHDHGGKDCYKVSCSLGGGASVPLVNGIPSYPPTNYRRSEILENTPEKVAFVLHYPEWEKDGIKISLDKKITVIPDTYFLKAEDTWSFTGADSLTIAAGINRHTNQNTVVEEYSEADRYALWEQASDQGHEPEDGFIGVAVIMPQADSAGLVAGGSHGACIKKISSGETLTYYFGNCWSKGEIKTTAQWFDKVNLIKFEDK
ncbi:MAG: DUF4861 domain-containing protein [Bacteroidales bacterium]|nr:DUF4861 domain-containing protein [Bacteroidales bacterium]